MGRRSDRTPARAGYHHGALREALITGAKQMLQEKGTEGFSLREVARRAGVSAAAPSHHFGSVAGLLSELAMQGFERLTQRLAVDSSLTPTHRLRAQGEAYVRFAFEQPAIFQLMFRKDLLDPMHEGLNAAGGQAYAQLEDTVRAMVGIGPGRPLPEQAQSQVLAAWSIVHGFAHLALDGKLSREPSSRSGKAALIKRLQDTLASVWP